MLRHGYSKLESEPDAADIQMESLDGPSSSSSSSLAAPAAAAASSAPAVVEDQTVEAFTPPTEQQQTQLEGDAAASASDAATNAAGATSAFVPPTDGVFSNVAAVKKVDQPPKYEDDRLPEYGEVFQGTVTPGVYGNVIVTPIPSDTLVDGMHVGNAMTFVLSMLVGWLFGIVGFLCAYLMSTTHAGRCGARAGIGLQLIHWGIYMQSYMTQYDWYTGSNLEGSFTFDEYPMPRWLSYIFMLAGWFIFVRACTNFFQVRRILHMRLAGLIAQ